MTAADVDAIVLGAGGSARMDGRDKMLAPLGGQPVIVWSLRAFEAAPSIRRVIVTSSDENGDGIQAALESAQLSKVGGVIKGGATRQHSVLAALEWLESDAPSFVAVHDGARPFATPTLIERGVVHVRHRGAAVAAVRSRDTVKLVAEDAAIVDTPPRARVWLAHTPQLAGYTDLLRAHWNHRDGLDRFTDDASILEADGVPTFVFQSDHDNFKITTVADLERAERLATARRGRRMPV